MRFSVHLLGTGSAIPTATRFTTSQLLNIREQYYLIDCGEGTQIQLRKYHFKFQRIACIFISHLHADHYLGLFGLLGTMALLGREKPLKLFAPPQLKELLDQHLKVQHSKLGFELQFHPLAMGQEQEIYRDKVVTVSTIPLNHRIPCSGFLFREVPGPRKLRAEALEAFAVPIRDRERLRAGEDFTTAEGERIDNQVFTIDPTRARSYAYCSDTRYKPELVPVLEKVDLLYHEATFLEKHRERAEVTHHSTAAEAAKLAAAAQVGQLVIGHYSARYHELQPFLEEARQFFPHTSLGQDGLAFSIPSDNT